MNDLLSPLDVVSEGLPRALTLRRITRLTRRTRMKTPRHCAWRLIPIVALVALALIAGGCRSTPTPIPIVDIPNTPVPPTATPMSAPPTDTATPVPPTATSTPAPPVSTATPVPSTPTATPVPSTPTLAPPAATSTPTPVPSADNCVACHTDQGLLEEIAEDKTQKSEETEGEG